MTSRYASEAGDYATAIAALTDSEREAATTVSLAVAHGFPAEHAARVRALLAPDSAPCPSWAPGDGHGEGEA